MDAVSNQSRDVERDHPASRERERAYTRRIDCTAREELSAHTSGSGRGRSPRRDVAFTDVEFDRPRA
jgi:hypothetical protein